MRRVFEAGRETKGGWRKWSTRNEPRWRAPCSALALKRHPKKNIYVRWWLPRLVPSTLGCKGNFAAHFFSAAVTGVDDFRSHSSPMLPPPWLHSPCHVSRKKILTTAVPETCSFFTPRDNPVAQSNGVRNSFLFALFLWVGEAIESENGVRHWDLTYCRRWITWSD